MIHLAEADLAASDGLTHRTLGWPCSVIAIQYSVTASCAGVLSYFRLRQPRVRDYE